MVAITVNKGNQPYGYKLLQHYSDFSFLTTEFCIFANINLVYAEGEKITGMAENAESQR